MPRGGGLKKSVLRGGFKYFFGTTQLGCHACCWVILLWYACGADEQVTVTWLPKVLGWVDYHIFLGMRLHSRAQWARMELHYDLIDPCVSVLFITINIYSPSLGKCATGSIVFSICTSYKRKKETWQLNCSFRAIILNCFWKSIPGLQMIIKNDLNIRSKQFSSHCQSLK